MSEQKWTGIRDLQGGLNSVFGEDVGPLRWLGSRPPVPVLPSGQHDICVGERAGDGQSGLEDGEFPVTGEQRGALVEGLGVPECSNVVRD